MFEPNDTERVRTVSEHRYLYVELPLPAVPLPPRGHLGLAGGSGVRVGGGTVKPSEQEQTEELRVELADLRSRVRTKTFFTQVKTGKLSAPATDPEVVAGGTV